MTNVTRRSVHWIVGAAMGYAAFTCLPATPARAQDDAALERIGVVDLQHILRDSVAAQGVRQEVEAQQETYRSEISAKEDALRTKQEELQRQRTVMAPEAFAERESAFAKEVEELQRDVVARNKQLEEVLAYGMNQVQSAALNIVAEIADQRSYTIVLDKSQVLLVSKNLDFSTTVVDMLNERLPAVSTTPPESSE